MHVQAAPVSNSQLIVVSLILTFSLGRSCTPLSGFIMSQILFTVAMETAQRDIIICGITWEAMERGFFMAFTENPAWRPLLERRFPWLELLWASTAYPKRRCRVCWQRSFYGSHLGGVLEYGRNRR